MTVIIIDNDRYRNRPSGVLNVEDFGALVAEKRRREGLSIRAAAADAGVSFPVLARVEKGHLPDLDNYRRIVRWLGGEETDVRPSGTAMRPESTPDLIARHLQLDPHLSGDARERIANVVREMYEALARPGEAVRVHLRAARTFRPAAAAVLAELLDEMRASLLRDGSR